MKLKEGFLLRELAGRIVVVPTGGTLDLNMMISLNEPGRLLWERLARGASPEELEELLLEEYEVGREQARADVERFLAKLRENGILEEL